MKDEARDELDHLLDAGLASYTAEEPRAGLEERVMWHVRAARPKRRMAGWWSLTAVAAVAAVLIVGVWVHGTRTAPTVAPLRPILSVARVPETPPQRSAQPPGRMKVRLYTKARPQLPKRDQFPSPVPLSDEERSLVTLVTRYPEMARELLETPVTVEPEPIRIEEVQIEPLKNGDLQGEGSDNAKRN